MGLLLAESNADAPAHAAALFEAARIHAFELKDPETAIRSYERYLARYPEHDRVADARFQIAGLYYEQKNHAEAKRRFEEFLRAHPGTPLTAQAQKWIAKCDKASREEERPAATDLTPSATAVLLKRANARFLSGAHAAAAKEYERVIRESRADGESEEATFQLAKCQAALGDIEKALANFGSLARRSGHSEWQQKALLEAGSLTLDKLNRPAEARSNLERLLAAGPPKEIATAARRLLGLSWFRERNYDKALPHFVAVSEAAGGPDPNAPPTGLDRLIKACKEKRPLTAGADFGSGLQHPWLHIGDEHYTARQWEEAIEAYDRVIKESSDKEQIGHALLHKGRCYYKLWEYDKALECYRPFLDKYRDTKAAPAALLRAGVIYTSQGDRAESRRMYHLFLERYPNDEEAQRTFTNLLYLDYWDGDLEEALAKSKEYVKRYPQGPFCQFHLKDFQPRLRAALAEQNGHPVGMEDTK